MKAVRFLGLALLAAAYLPLHRLLDPTSTGRAGQVTRSVTELAWGGAVWGTLMVLGLSFLLAWMLSWDPVPAVLSYAPGRGLASWFPEPWCSRFGFP
jgi:hypothetical protein